jgi:REP element-mobilizing transposase RayT
VLADQMKCNHFGEIVQSCWNDLTTHYLHIELDAFVVMPNHVHGIVFLFDHFPPGTSVQEGLKPSPTTPKLHSLTEIIRAL